jgi:hypothetical protein
LIIFILEFVVDVSDACEHNCSPFSRTLEELKLKYEEKQTPTPETRSPASENVGNYKKAHVNLLAEVKARKKI